MREIKIGNKEVKIKATPLALLFYKQEFKSDLMGAMMKMQEVKKDLSQIDSLAILQITWAMAKAADIKSTFPSFTKWLSELDSVDFSDKDFLWGVMEEATDGFFRTGSEQLRKSKQ